MDNLFILMLLYLAYTGISFWIFNANFLSPSFVFSLSLSIMLCLAYYTAVNLGMLFAINIETFTIFAIAGFIFLATEFFVYSSHSADYIQNNKIKLNAKNPEPLLINWQIQFIYTCFITISLILAVYVLYANTSASTWGARMTQYKENLLYHPEVLKYRFIMAQIYKVNIVTMYLFGYVMIYNLTVCNVPVKKIIFYIIDTLIYCVYSAVTTGARQTSIEVILFLIMIYITLNMKPEGRRKVRKFIFKASPALIILASLFTYAGKFVGRVETKKSSLQNLAEYICGGLYSFNLHINDGASTKLWGQSSFSYIYAIPQNMGLMPRTDDIMITGEFDLYGNTVTIFGRWYKDFGSIGVYVMSCIVSLLYSLCFYKKIIYSNNINNEHHLARIFYCQFMTGLIWAGYDDRIGSLLTVQTVFFLIMVSYLFDLLIRKKFRIF